MRPTNSNVSFNSDCKSHVDGGTEGHRGHWVEDVDIQLGEGCGHCEPAVDNGQSGSSVNWHIGYYVPKLLSYIIVCYNILI